MKTCALAQGLEQGLEQELILAPWSDVGEGVVVLGRGNGESVEMVDKRSSQRLACVNALGT